MKRDDLGYNADGTRSIVHVDDNSLVIERTQDVAPILDQNKAAQSNGFNANANMRHAAAIPAIVWQQWDKEFYQMHKRSLLGAPRKLKDKFMKAKLNDPDNRFLRTWQGKL